MDLFLKFVYSLIINFVCFFAGYLACRQEVQRKRSEASRKLMLRIADELKKLEKENMDDERKG